MSITPVFRPGAVAAPAAAPGRYRFLRSRRWLGITALAVLLSLACTGLGFWQWDRHTVRLEAASLVRRNYDAPPVPLADVLPPEGSALEPDVVWRPVNARGAYLDDGAVLLRNRPVSGTPAHHVLAPLVVEMSDGSAAILVVDRGWLPAGSEDAVARAVPRRGEVDVVVRLREPEGADPRSAPPGQVYTVAPADVVAASREAGADVPGVPVLPAYGVLAAEDPPADGSPLPLPRPDTELGTHLSYTFQWWLFAIGALVGLVVLARREADALAADSADARPAPLDDARRGAPRRERRPGRAEQEEDAILDGLRARGDTAGAPRDALVPTAGRSAGSAQRPPTS